MNHRPTSCALAALLCAGAASAQTSDRPWYLGAAQDFTYQSNVFRTTGSKSSDTVSTTTLRGGVNALLSRQRLFANGAFNHVRYGDFSGRNYNGYNVGAGLDWETVGRLSGNLSYIGNRQESDFNLGLINPVSIRNIESNNTFDARARLGVVTPLTVEGGIGRREVDFSAPEYDFQEYDQDYGNLGVVYRLSGALSLSGGVFGSQTDYRVPAPGQLAADRSKRRDVYLGANWVPTGASTVNARVNFGKQEYEIAKALDYDGLTGYVTWGWTPTGRTAVTTTLSRDSGRDTGFLKLRDNEVGSATDFAKVTNRLAVGVNYELTGKIDLDGTLSYSRRTLVDGLTGDEGRDNIVALRVGARWAVTRVVTLGCNVGREERSSKAGGLSSDYRNDRFGCYGAVLID